MRSFAALGAAVIGACTGQTGENPIEMPCDKVTSVVDAATVTGLGYSADELRAAVGGPVTEPLTWTRHGETELTVEVVGEPTEVRFADRSLDGEDVPSRCGDALELDVTVALSTADGAFAETWTLTLWSEVAGIASFAQDLDAVALAGTFDAWDHAEPTSDYESLGAEILVTLVAGGSSGEVVLQGAGWADPDCREQGCTEWESRETAGTWGH